MEDFGNELILILLLGSVVGEKNEIKIDLGQNLCQLGKFQRATVSLILLDNPLVKDPLYIVHSLC